MRQIQQGRSYVAPSIETFRARDIIEALGPVAAGSGTRADECQYVNVFQENYCG